MSTETTTTLVNPPLLRTKDLPVIMNAVTEVTGVTEETIITRNRTTPVLLARHLFVGVARQLIKCKQQVIADYIQRDHTSIGNAESAFSNLYDTEKSFRCQYDEVMLKLHEKYNN